MASRIPLSDGSTHFIRQLFSWLPVSYYLIYAVINSIIVLKCTTLNQFFFGLERWSVLLQKGFKKVFLPHFLGVSSQCTNQWIILHYFILFQLLFVHPSMKPSIPITSSPSTLETTEPPTTPPEVVAALFETLPHPFRSSHYSSATVTPFRGLTTLSEALWQIGTIKLSTPVVTFEQWASEGVMRTWEGVGVPQQKLWVVQKE